MKYQYMLPIKKMTHEPRRQIKGKSLPRKGENKTDYLVARDWGLEDEWHKVSEMKTLSN